MVAAWDQRRPSDHQRVERLVLSRWLPVVLGAAPFYAARDGDTDERLLTDRAGLRRLAPVRERDLTADSPGGSSAVLLPTEEQVKATAESDVLGRMVRAIRREGAAGKRDVLLEEFRPLQLHRGGPDGALLVASSRSDLDRLHRTGARAAAVLGLDDGDVVVSAVPAGPTLEHLGVVHLAAGASLTALHARGTGDDLDACAAAMATLAPTVLVVPVAEAASLAAVLEERRVDVHRVRLVVTVGPPPAGDDRARIEAAFRGARADANVLALWGPSNGRALWAECAPGSGLHTYPDLEVLEVLDPLTGAPSDAGGDLTLTSAGWHGTGLVRFQTGTWLESLVTDAPCPRCERTVPRLDGEIAPHAWERPVRMADGGQVHVDLRGVAAVMASLDGVTAWRAELRGPSDVVPRDRLVVEVAGASQPTTRDLLERFERATGLVPEVVSGRSEPEVDRATEAAGGILADRR